MTEKDPRRGADGPVDDDADDAEEVDADVEYEPDYDETNPEYDEKVPDAPDDVDSYGDDDVERPDEEPALDSEVEDAEDPDDGANGG